jgi:hypothetical protein
LLAITRSVGPAAGRSGRPTARGSTPAANAAVVSAATAATGQARSASAAPRGSRDRAAAYGVKAISGTRGQPRSRPHTRSTAHSANGATGTPARMIAITDRR